MANAASIKDECIARLIDAFPPLGQRKESRSYMLCGYGIYIVGQSQADIDMLGRALRHAESSYEKAPELTIEIHSKRPSDFFEWMRAMFGDRVLRIQTARYRFLYNPGVNTDCAKFSFLDMESGRALFWADDIGSLPWYEIAAPFRTIFHWFFRQHNILLVHGASMGTADASVLLIGKGGSGKSSTALTAFSRAGMSYAGDDYVLVQMGAVPVVTSLYSSAKISPASLSRFGCFTRTPIRMPAEGEDKAVLFPCEHAGEVCVPSLRITALALPVVMSANQTTWERMHAAHALLALAPSTIFQLQPEDTFHDSFEVLAALVKQIPAYRILLGTEVNEIGNAMHQFLTTL